MCIQNTLQQHILDLTNDGKDVADFFYATMHGLNPNAKFHHQMEAAKHLSKLALDTALSLTTAEDPASSNADVSQSPLSPRERVRVRAKILPILYILLGPPQSQTQTSSTTK